MDRCSAKIVPRGASADETVACISAASYDAALVVFRSWVGTMLPTDARMVFSYGLFSRGTQVLLFREGLPALGGYDLCVGVFAAGSFLRATAGIAILRRTPRCVFVEIALLACVLGLCVQYGLIPLAGGAFAAVSSLIAGMVVTCHRTAWTFD